MTCWDNNTHKKYKGSDSSKDKNATWQLSPLAWQASELILIYGVKKVLCIHDDKTRFGTLHADFFWSNRQFKNTPSILAIFLDVEVLCCSITVVGLDSKLLVFWYLWQNKWDYTKEASSRQWQNEEGNLWITNSVMLWLYNILFPLILRPLPLSHFRDKETNA